MIPKNEQNVLDLIALLRSQWFKRFEHEQAETAWLDMMVDELKGYDEQVLKEAGRSLLRKKLRGFPLLAECHDACAEAKRFFEWRAPKLPAVAHRGDRPGKHVSLANDLIRGPLGREAAREGWILCLWDHIKAKGELPKQGEVEKLRATARETEALYADLCAGRVGLPTARPMLIQMAERMFQRREELARLALGEEAA